MTVDELRTFIPMVMLVLAPVITGLGWAAKYFVNQINAKDVQLEKSAEANKQLAVNTTLALEKFTESNRAQVAESKEMNRLLQTLIELQKDTTRAVSDLEDDMNRSRPRT
jgi:nitrate reductase alpha subunit